MPRVERSRRRAWRVLFFFFLGSIAPGFAKDAGKKATIGVTGLGWLHNRDQRLSLERLLGEQRGEVIESNAIEDAAFLLLSALQGKGFLKPTIEIEVVRAEGGKRERLAFDTTLTTPLPRPLVAREVIYHVNQGVRYAVSDVRISGLNAVPPEKARGFFMPGQALYATGEARAYTPARLRRAVENLQEALQQLGYAGARVRTEDVQIDDKSGHVSLAVEVVEGPRWEVNDVKFVGSDGADVTLDFASQFAHRPWTPLWQQDLRERVRHAFYEKGFPEVSVALEGRPAAEAAGVKPVEVVATVVPGPRVKVGEVHFEGNARTKESVLRRRVAAKPGDPLDPISLERSRYRLSRLGVFSTVDLRFDPPDGEVRDPVFLLKEAPRREANLMFGYGSYEQVRAGIEYRQLNLFGLAHQSRVEVVQSMKSSRGEYVYTVPEIFGETIDGTSRLFGLQRQERSFLRQEFGLTLALKRQLPWFKIDATTGYTYQALRNKENTLGTSGADGTDVTVGSADIGLTSDLRDNPLRPRHGYRWFVQLEAASRQLGGETDYQRLETGAAFHTQWGNTRWIHLGVTHGVITTQGATDDRLLPVNKRFFPGGDSSIRGFPQGAAAPRGADGRFIGAKTYLLINAELEQALTSNWSVVLFGDALGESVQLSRYPMDEKLYAVGLGVRYQTLIGPVRLEYGRNLNPRPADPPGTLHVSVGFPF
jgi:outer membrane protein insertion porin family